MSTKLDANPRAEPGRSLGDGDVGCRLTRFVFLRGLALVFLIAFVSAWVQIDGLVGSHGVFPVAEFMARARASLGATSLTSLPTLCWWWDGDGALHVQCALGALLSIVLLVGCASRLVIAGLWILYLSLSIAGQSFFAFQWDVLLLETALFAFFLAPASWGARIASQREPSPVALFLVRWLCFRLVFASGAVKLASGDATWSGLRALDFHYWTQPIPNPVSPLAASLPDWSRLASCALMFAVELVLPFGLFGPRIVRRTAALGIIAFQLAIEATGNFGFFNLLTIVLCTASLDDVLLARLLPRRIVEAARATPVEPRSRLAMRVQALLAAPFVIASGWLVAEQAFPTAVRVPAIVEEARDRVAWTRSWNTYGLFRVMTTTRPELVVEGSDDGRGWREIAFRYKPGALDRTPPLVAPHMPRLDWQMWFAALGSPRDRVCVERLCRRIVNSERAVLDLLADPGARAPRYVRVVLYDYRFTDARRQNESGSNEAASRPGGMEDIGEVWSRRRRGVWFGPIEARR